MREGKGRGRGKGRGKGRGLRMEEEGCAEGEEGGWEEGHCFSVMMWGIGGRGM